MQHNLTFSFRDLSAVFCSFYRATLYVIAVFAICPLSVSV